MGPAATAYFFQQLVDRVGAARDQDHPQCVVYNATQVPDRTAHLTGGGADPTAALREAGRTLERAGADFIAIPCNSAHAYLASIQDAVDIDVLDMIDLTSAHAATMLPSAGSVGVLAATGTIELGLYDRALEEHGLQLVRPQQQAQAGVMTAIRALKGAIDGPRAGARDALEPAIDELVAAGAEVLVLGCTELPLLDLGSPPLPVLDATEVLVLESLARCGVAQRS